jgi:hypothetical protein
VRPFLVEGADEALGLAVPARRARRDEDVPGVELAEGGLERAAGAVGHRVVGHDGLEGAGACSCIQAAAAQHRGGDVAAVVAVHLDVGQAGVVIDDDMRELDVARADRPADLARAIAVRPQCPGSVNTGSCLASMCSSAPGSDHS